MWPSVRVPRLCAIGLCAIGLGALALSCAPAPTIRDAVPVQIVPRPSTLVLSAETFVLEPSATIAAPDALRAEAELLAMHWVDRPLDVTTDLDSSITLALDDALAPEAYVLDVDARGVRLRGGTSAGVWWGIQTLLLLLPPSAIASAHADEAFRLPAVHVEDAPRFAHRGLLFDEARWFFGADFVRRLVDWMSLHKLNVLHWHLTDDQGWRLPIASWPRLTGVGAWRAGSQEGEWFGETRAVDWTPEAGAYTRDEVVAIVAYAASRHVTIVPEIDLPGHTVAALAAYPELACTPGPFAVSPYFETHEDVLCVCDDRAMAFAHDVLDEVMDVFPSEVIHLGGDEVPTTRWQAEPRCADRVASLGLASVDELRGWFVAELARYLEAHGRRAIVWNDARSDALPTSARVQVWTGDPASEAMASAMRGDVVMSPSEETYLNRSYARIPMTTSYAFEPVPDGLAPALAARIVGLEACMWTPWDGTVDDVEHKMFPRMAAYAEVGWSAAGDRDQADFARRLPAMQARYDALDIAQTR